jgi:hypothetical protein
MMQLDISYGVAFYSADVERLEPLGYTFLMHLEKPNSERVYSLVAYTNPACIEPQKAGE